MAAAAEAPPKIDVEIAGVEGELLDNVHVLLGIFQASKRESFLSRINPFSEEKDKDLSARRIRTLHRKAPEEIRQALQPFGYYQPEIDSKLKRTDKGWKARYKIDKGPATHVEKLEVRVEGEGKDMPAVQQALQGIKLKQGKRLVHSQYEAAKSALFNAAYKDGYIEAKYERSEIRVEPERQRAEIYLVLKTGPRFYFGDVKIEQDILDPDFVQRFNTIEPGEPFNADRLIDLQLLLNDSDYFRQVEIQAQRDQTKNQRVPVTVKTRPSKPQRYVVGAGFGTDTGPRLNLGVKLRRINRLGHHFRTDLRLSLVKSTLASQYIIPVGDITTDRLAFAATLQQAEFGGADSTQFIVGPSLTQRVHGFQRRLYLNYQRELFSFDEGPNRQANLLTPGITLSRKRADDQLYPTKGYSVVADLHGGLDSVISATSFLRPSVDSRFVWPLGERSRLLVHAEAGADLAGAFSDLPPSQRFFTGGSRTVRGYGYQNIGARNAADTNIGGEYLLVGGVEADRLFYKDLGAAVFFDAGDAFVDAGPNFQKGAGLGLRYRSPVGMIRLDFAHPFDDPDSNFMFHLSIGPDL